MSDEPTISSMLVQQITTLEVNLNRRLDITERTMGERLDRQDKTLEEIKQQTQLTNGRVTVLEKARERAQGVMAAYRWVPVAMAALLTAGTTILVMALSGALH